MSEWKKYMEESDAFAEKIYSMPHRVCDGNPYVMVFENQEDAHVHHLYFDAHSKGASAWMHVIEGEEKAMLIDTGFGVGDLKGLLKTLTDKPLIVVNTHFHGDHSAGDGQFDEVLCHTYDVPYLKRVMASGGAGRMLPPKGAYREEDLVPIHPIPVREIRDGERIVLGPDHEVEVIHMPGHAAGGCMFLDHKSGFLFTGDAVCFTPTLIIGRFPNPDYPEYLTVTAFYEALKRAMPRLSGVKKLYTGHSIQGISPVYLEDMVKCCEKIIAHPDQYEVYDYVSDPSQRQIMCVGHAMIVYTDNRI